MRKMLCCYALALFALVACSGGRIVSPPPPISCTQLTPASSSFTVARGGSLSVSYTSNCNTVVATSDHPDVFPSQTLPANGTLVIDNATVSMTITLTGKGSSNNTLTAQVAVNVQQPAPSLHIASAPDSVVLNHSIKLTLNTQNVRSCSYSTSWQKTGKEDSATIAPVFADKAGICTPTFNPGSTMPDSSMHHKVQLKVCGTGYDGQTQVCDSVTVRLAIPKIVVDSASPTTIVSGVPTVVSTYSRDSSFTTSNGVDYLGTLFGETNLGYRALLVSDLVRAPGMFKSPAIWQAGTVSVLGANENDHYYVDYFANSGQPDPPASYMIHVVRN